MAQFVCMCYEQHCAHGHEYRTEIDVVVVVQQLHDHDQYRTRRPVTRGCELGSVTVGCLRQSDATHLSHRSSRTLLHGHLLLEQIYPPIQSA